MAVWHAMTPALAAECAIQMRNQDPVHAARVLIDASVALLELSNSAPRALGYLDMVCLLVIEHHVRPDRLLDLLRGTMRRFQIWGSAAILPHQPLWNRVIDVLSEKLPAPAPAPGPAGRTR